MPGKNVWLIWYQGHVNFRMIMHLVAGTHFIARSWPRVFKLE